MIKTYSTLPDDVWVGNLETAATVALHITRTLNPREALVGFAPAKIVPNAKREAGKWVVWIRTTPEPKDMTEHKPRAMRHGGDGEGGVFDLLDAETLIPHSTMRKTVH